MQNIKQIKARKEIKERENKNMHYSSSHKHKYNYTLNDLAE